MLFLLKNQANGYEFKRKMHILSNYRVKKVDKCTIITRKRYPLVTSAV